MAEAVRNGDPVARVPLPDRFRGLGSETIEASCWLDEVRGLFTVVHVEFVEADIQTRVEAFDRKWADDMVRRGRKLSAKAGGRQTLHAALDGYAVWVAGKYVGLDRKPTAWGGTRAGRSLSSSGTCRTTTSPTSTPASSRSWRKC